jgi:uncharacterized membrane protein
VKSDEELKRAWQSQFAGHRVVLHEDLILQQLRRQQRDFRNALYGADVLLVVLSFVLLAVVGYLFLHSRATGSSLPDWVVLIVAVPLAGLAGFTIVDRLLQVSRHPKREDSVRAWAESMLAEVVHRIWLFKRALWWLVLPIFLVADGGFQAYVAWQVGWAMGTPKDAVLGALQALVEPVLLGVAVCFFFRWMVRKDLEVRKVELQALVDSLEMNGSGD